VISRGLDVDQYSLMLVYDCSFAQPFWSVADKNVANAIISDETTNSVLRISPTQRRDEGHMKVIVMRERDWWKVKYLEGRETIAEMKPEQLAEILLNLEVGGKVEYSSDGTVVTTRGIDNNFHETRKEKP
jgi:hypothetical protein